MIWLGLGIILVVVLIIGWVAFKIYTDDHVLIDDPSLRETVESMRLMPAEELDAIKELVEANDRKSI